MVKKALKALLVLMVVVLGAIALISLFFALLFSSTADNLSKKEIFALVNNNEALLRTVITEIAEIKPDIDYISTTQKSELHNTDYEDIEGLYIGRNDGRYESNDNDVFETVMQLKGLKRISISVNGVEFYCGGKGIVPSSSYYGFYYYADDDNVSVGKEEVQGNTFYTEKIIVSVK